MPGTLLETGDVFFEVNAAVKHIALHFSSYRLSVSEKKIDDELKRVVIWEEDELVLEENSCYRQKLGYCGTDNVLCM